MVQLLVTIVKGEGFVHPDWLNPVTKSGILWPIVHVCVSPFSICSLNVYGIVFTSIYTDTVVSSVQVGARFMVWVSSILKTIGVTSWWLCSLQSHFREGIDQMYLFFSIGFYPQWSRGFLLCFRNKTKSVLFFIIS